MADILKLSILSPERRLMDQVEINAVTLPTSEGQIQVLPGHAAMIGTLETGVFNYQLANGTDGSGVISTGFFEVKEGIVSVMAETFELREEINLARAQTAQKKAETALQGAALDEHQFRKYQLKLQRALVRQQVSARDHPAG
ncbi:MAG: ATP synthase F1 subunit epsilon [Methylotenera sp.]|nr:ATP synthase F1 subunit epsilon [Oligoflexia bacterium]